MVMYLQLNCGSLAHYVTDFICDAFFINIVIIWGLYFGDMSSLETR